MTPNPDNRMSGEKKRRRNPWKGITSSWHMVGTWPGHPDQQRRMQMQQWRTPEKGVPLNKPNQTL